MATFALLMGMVACGGNTAEDNNESDNAAGQSAEQGAAAVKEPEIPYGIDKAGYTIERFTIESGETVGKILNRHGISAARIDRLDKIAKEVYSLSKFRAGNNYTLFLRNYIDEEGVEKSVADYMIYHINKAEYVVYDIRTDEPTAVIGSAPRENVRKYAEATITTSLWDAIVGQGLSWSLASEFEDIYQWTVDFFHIQEGDSFAVIYDDEMVEGESVGIGRIWGAKFNHGTKEYYAIPYALEDGKLRYWEHNGESLRKQMLKAPLKYTRISSKFSNSRLHPVHKVYRPHHGVDYAAPAGTPVHSVADGTVTFAGWGGGGGNTIKIKHAGNLMTGYLHLKSFAKGIKVGAKVSQGDLIGYALDEGDLQVQAGLPGLLEGAQTLNDEGAGLRYDDHVGSNDADDQQSQNGDDDDAKQTTGGHLE